MIIRQMSRAIEKSNLKCLNCTKYNQLVSRYFSDHLNEGPAKRQVRKLDKWREDQSREPKSFLALWDSSIMEGAPLVKNRDTSFGNPVRGEEFDFSFASVKEAWIKHKSDIEKSKQKCEPYRLDFLGSDLTVAYFLLNHGKKVKFRGHDDWMVKIEGQKLNLPLEYNPKYVLSAVDCTDLDIYYEGFLNFENLTRIKWASFQGNQVFDEWCLDRVAGQIPCLEYLDISNCPQLNENGLECIYKLFYLKKLIVTNHHKSVAFELTCLMLEDCNPNLECVILQPGEKYTEDLEKEIQKC